MSNQKWKIRAEKILPAASFGNFNGDITIAKAKGSHVIDQDGNEYVDYLIGSGPMILGHGHPEVIEAVIEALPNGTTSFANNDKGIELAEEIIKAMECAEKVRFVSSGSEADMYAIRLARAFTGRQKILKFEGGYHGMSAEAQMSLAPQKLANFPKPVPDSAGIPESVRDEVVVSQFNDNQMTTEIMDEYGNDIAAIIVEPLQRIIPPQDGFLECLRRLADKYNALLIFDEIVTGFRFDYGGAQKIYGVTPDVCTLGKIIGGGFPLAAIAGKNDVMELFDKKKSNNKFLMQMGTLSGNPIAATAGLKTLEILRRKNQYQKLINVGERIQKIFNDALKAADIKHKIIGHPTLFDVVFAHHGVTNYRHVLNSDQKMTIKFNKNLINNGIFKSAGKCYTSLAITKDDLDKTKNAIQKSINNII